MLYKLLIYFMGYLDWYHYIFPKLEIYHYNSPIPRYTITNLISTNSYHYVPFPAAWAHCQAYMDSSYFRMDHYALVRPCEETPPTPAQPPSRISLLHRILFLSTAEEP
jgi:hypothetical protein